MVLDFNDKSLISSFFNESGYVLDFTDATFERFTTNSVGFSVKDKYQKSKGKSFSEFVHTERDNIVLKLTSDLIKYIDQNRIKLTDIQNEQLPKLEMIISNNSDTFTFSSDLVTEVADKFDNSFIDNQMKIMLSLLEKSPTDVIGKSKELLESCFKHILDENELEYSNSDTISTLQKKVFTLLNLDVKTNIAAQENTDVKLILSSFNQIIRGLNSLRNEKGDGHGKGKEFQELPKRYGQLAMNSSLTIVHFVWDTYEYWQTL